MKAFIFWFVGKISPALENVCLHSWFDNFHVEDNASFGRNILKVRTTGTVIQNLAKERLVKCVHRDI